MSASTLVAFFISDGTGITAESLGTALLAQFDLGSIERHTIPFVNNATIAQKTVDRIREIEDLGSKAMVVSTIVNPSIRELVKTAGASYFQDYYETSLPGLEIATGLVSNPSEGQAHGIANSDRYFKRMAAVEYSMEHDDGQSLRALDQADIILVAPSRCGKTPTSMYLALQHGLKTANFPLVDEDFFGSELPLSIRPHRAKLFGLVASPQRLSAVRNERRSHSKYASIEQCRFEIAQAQAMFEDNQIPYTDSSNRSVEEIAAIVLEQKHLRD